MELRQYTLRSGRRDAGYNKDFITAQGISDAFRDAELGATALDQALSGSRPFDEAMREYQEKRDTHVLPMYEFTACGDAPAPAAGAPEVLAAANGNQEAMDGFARVNAGVTSPAEFFSEENVGRILSAADEARTRPSRHPDGAGHG